MATNPDCRWASWCWPWSGHLQVSQTRKVQPVHPLLWRGHWSYPLSLSCHCHAGWGMSGCRRVGDQGHGVAVVSAGQWLLGPVLSNSASSEGWSTLVAAEERMGIGWSWWDSLDEDIWRDFGLCYRNQERSDNKVKCWEAASGVMKLEVSWKVYYKTPLG